MTLIDTADAYRRDASDVGHNESLIAKALAGTGATRRACSSRPRAGTLRPGDGSWTLNGSPEYLKPACEASLERLGIDADRALPVPPAGPAGRPTRSRLGGIGTCSTQGKIARAGHLQRQPGRRSGWRTRSSAGDWCRCRTSTRRRSAPSEPELDALRRARLAFLPWSPLGGMRGAGGLGDQFARVRRGGAAARRQPAAGRPWPGSWPGRTTSSRSRDRAARSRSWTRPRRCTCGWTTRIWPRWSGLIARLLSRSVDRGLTRCADAPGRGGRMAHRITAGSRTARPRRQDSGSPWKSSIVVPSRPPARCPSRSTSSGRVRSRSATRRGWRSSQVGPWP